MSNDQMKEYSGSPNIIEKREKSREDEPREEQSLLKQMLHFQERDRQLIAYEIHDGLIQDVTAAQMLLGYLIKSGNLPEGEARQQIQEANRLVQKAVEEARQLIGGLRPPILEEMGVVSAISYLIDNLPRNMLTIDFDAKVQSTRFEPLLEATIYRIVQQAINNIQRHSRADRAKIGLTQQGNWIHVEIQDWGIGFDPSSVSEDRFGLQGIRDRARLMRGRAVIESAPGKGTHINVDLPLA
jgi:signal transduction histidine kinase